MKTSLFSYLFSLIILQISCHSTEEKLVGSKTKSQDSLVLKTLLTEITENIHQNQNDSALKKSFRLKNLAEKNPFYSAKAHSILGYLNLISGKDDSAYLYYNEAKELFSDLKDSVNSYKVLTNMAIIQSNKGDYNGSEVVSIDALKFVKTKKDIPSLDALYNNLAICSDAQFNHKEAIYWFSKALEVTQDSYSKVLYTNNLAVSYKNLKDYEKAISILKELEKDSILLKNPHLKAKVWDNFAYCSWLNNSKYSGDKLMKSALQIRQEIGDEFGQIANYSHLVQFYENKDKKQAVEYAQKMYEISTKLNSPTDRLEALKFLINLDNPDQSKNHAITYSSLQDSLNQARNQVKEQFAKIRFDTEKNREENQILRAETAEQKLELEKRKLWGFISGTIILLSMIGFWAYQRIQKIKNQKRLVEEIHQTETKIARKVHDELSNNIYQLMSTIEHSHSEMDANEKENLLNQLDSIYKLSRDISRENQQIETGENFDEEILNLVSSYKNEQTNIILLGFNKENWIPISREIKIQFYKTLQELLTNMKKHSGASLVVLSFKFEKNKLDFLYSDNGIGIQKNEFISKNGMQITETRIAKINGAISFVSDQSRGLKINISIPI